MRPDELGLEPVVLFQPADLPETQVDGVGGHVGHEVLPVAHADANGEPGVRGEEEPQGRRNGDLGHVGADGGTHLADVGALEEADLALELSPRRGEASATRSTTIRP